MNMIQEERAKKAAKKVLYAKGSSKAEKTKNGSALSKRIVKNPYGKGKVDIDVIRRAVKAAVESRDNG